MDEPLRIPAENILDKMIDQNKKIILGIDPGIERVGIAILQKDPNRKPKEVLLYSECFKTNKTLPTEKRLALIYSKIKDLLLAYKPDILAIEKIFFTVNQKTAIIVAQARGTILAAAGEYNVDIIELSPTEIKESITGNGRANKEDILRMVPKIITLPDNATQDDELDAIAIALSASSKLRYSQIR